METPGKETSDKVGEDDGDDSRCGDDDGEDDIGDKVCTSLLILQFLFSSVRSSNSHPDLLLIQQHHPTFSDHTGPQHWTFTF